MPPGKKITTQKNQDNQKQEIYLLLHSLHSHPPSPTTCKIKKTFVKKLELFHYIVISLICMGIKFQGFRIHIQLILVYFFHIKAVFFLGSLDFSVLFKHKINTQKLVFKLDKLMKPVFIILKPKLIIIYFIKSISIIRVLVVVLYHLNIHTYLDYVMNYTGPNACKHIS